MQKPNWMFLMFFRKVLGLFFSVLLHHHHSSSPKRNYLHQDSLSRLGFQKFQFLPHRSDLENQVLIFHAEKALLKSSSLFPYFMLVAFEAGSLIRALLLFLFYPFILLLSHDAAIKAMVFISFLGLKKERFLEGSAVLPKLFLEDVGKESFEVLRRGRMKIVVSDLPQVMVESFLVDYLDVDVVLGRDLKVFCGFFLGVMEERRDDRDRLVKMSLDAVGVGCFRNCFHSQFFSHCKDIYLVSEQERRNWHQLPKDSYPKPLVFHDGRLAFKPTFLATLAMFMWLPFGFTLAIVRLIISLAFHDLKFPILHLTGVRITSFFHSSLKQQGNNKLGKGALYVCNHRTLLDPLMISYCLKTPLTTVVYSLSRVSEILAPIKTVRLTRNRNQDAELMRKLLGEGDLVVCPEGTTCREPYLLRFSPLFTEMKDQVVPVAINYEVSMFYGTTARGFKSLDALFLLMNPWPSCSVRFLDPVAIGPGTSKSNVDDENQSFRFKQANMIQALIAKELGFTCTRLTRKDKYLILAGNDGIVKNGYNLL